jgi:RNA polymerase sigma factor for flagellar operon FliA
MTEYQQWGEERSHSKLVSRYLPLVDLHAAHLAASLPRHVSREDLVQSGVLGLLEALKRFDPSRGIKFETYAGRRIRGAMLDELRRLSWLPRSLFRQMRDLERISQRLAGSLGREPSELELASEMGMSLLELQKTVRQIHKSKVLSLEDKMRIPGPEDEGALDDILAREEKEILARAIDTLEDRYRLILALYYQENLKLKEIGLILGVSESRVCQLHARAVEKLRVIMESSYLQ